MIYWYRAKEEDVEASETDNDEIDIYAGYDDDGSRYVSVKIKHLEKVLKELEAKLKDNAKTSK